MSTPTTSSIAARIRLLPAPVRWMMASVSIALTAGLFVGPMMILFVEKWRFYLTPRGIWETMLVGFALTSVLAYITKPYLPIIRAHMETVPRKRRWVRDSQWFAFLSLYWLVWNGVAIVYLGTLRWTAVESYPQYSVLSTSTSSRRTRSCPERFRAQDGPANPMAEFCATGLPSTLSRGDRVQFTLQANDRAIYVHDVTIVP